MNRQLRFWREKGERLGAFARLTSAICSRPFFCHLRAISQQATTVKPNQRNPIVPELTEEYSVSLGRVREEFLITEVPAAGPVVERTV